MARKEHLKEEPDKSIKISGKAHRILRLRAAEKNTKMKKLIDKWLGI